jgi:hypothetical protein
MLLRQRKHELRVPQHSLFALVAILLVTACSSRVAKGVNIILNFDPMQSEAPSFDPTASGLISIFEHAEEVWEGIFEDVTGNLTINFWYEDLPNGSCGTNPAACHARINDDGVREIEANIRVDTVVNTTGLNRDWFIDPTPANSSEFNMVQTLWRGLSASQQINFFNVGAGSTPPATMEIGYTGNAIVGGAAEGKWDMVTSVLHEVGHALGLNSFNAAQVMDNDLDFDPDFVFGQSIAVKGDTASGMPDNSHLAPTNISLMCGGCAQTDFRRLPSHTDAFAIAAGGIYSILDVPRREFYGGSDWNTAGNWSGNRVPGTADTVFVRDAQGPGVTLASRLSAAGVAGNLIVSEGANVDTNAFKLDVTNDVTVTDLDTDIFIEPGGELEADEIFIQNESEIEMSGGTLDARILTIDEGTQLEGTAGAPIVEVLQLLINNGQIDANGDSMMAFSSTAALPWDLDGTTNTGIVDASDGNISFVFGGLSDPFDGTMRVGPGHVISIFAPWTNSSGTLDLNGGTTVDSRARMNGLLSGTIFLTGGEISASGIAHVDAPVFFFGGIFNPLVTLGVDDTLEFNGDTTIAGGTFTVGQGSVLSFDGDTTISGGTFNTVSNLSTQGVIFNGVTIFGGGTVVIGGIARQEGNATVDNPTTINAAIFDMDGTGVTANHTWTLNESLTVNADNIDSGNDIFHSHFVINHTSAAAPGKLTINLPGQNQWVLDAASNVIITGRTNVFADAVAGSDFTLEGTAAITNNVLWTARADIAGAIIINANSNLRILGGSIADPYLLEGALISGLGTLSTVGDRGLVGHGTIATQIDFNNQAELRADNGTLHIMGALNDVGVIGTADADGTLRVTNAWDTSVANRLELRGGTVTGAAIGNGGTTTGFGQITSTSFANNNVTSAGGGTLRLNSTTFPDLDGGADTGTINAVNGDINVPGDLAGDFVFRGTINVGAGRQFNMPNTGLANSGTVSLLSGAMTVQGFSQFAALNVNPGSSSITELGGGIRFQGGSMTSLNGDLNLIGNSLISSGATFSGPRSLFVASGGTLRIANGAIVGVRVANNGRAEVSASPGIALVNAFAQGTVGTYEAEIEGPMVGIHYDQLQVNGNANLAGNLDILINQNGGMYVDPVAAGSFHAFTLVAAGAVFGDFDSVFYAGGPLVPEFGVPGGDFVALASCGLFRIMDYSETDVQLINYRSLRGDANGDGAVDGSDFNIWNANKFTLGTEWPSGDFNCDGNTDGSDFNIWNANKFTSVALPLTFGGGLGDWDVNLVPEPSGLALLTLGFCIAAFRRRRRKALNHNSKPGNC